MVSSDSSGVRVIDLVVPEGPRIRLDVFISRSVDELSRERVQNLIKAGQIHVDGHAEKSSMKLEPGQQIRICIPPPILLDVPAEDLDVPVRFEDEDLIVIVKPRGMLTHPVGDRATGTLVNAMKDRCRSLSGINGVERPGIVHRLDQGTSGLMVVAKTDRAHQGLVDLFKEREVVKTYQAIVVGVPPHRRGVIDIPIGRHESKRNRMKIDTSRGRPSRTDYTLLESFHHHASLQLGLHTGRTHQIRVHMAHIGYPVLGDHLYGRGRVEGLEGFALHACRLSFLHPVSGEALDFQEALPDDMTFWLERLRTRESESTGP